MTFIRYAGPAVHAAVPCSLLSTPGTHALADAAASAAAGAVALLVADTALVVAAPGVAIPPCVATVQTVAETGAGATVQC